MSLRFHFGVSILRFVAFALLGSGLVQAAQAQTFGIQYGSRAFWAAPVGTNAVNVKYEQLNAFQGVNGIILEGFEIDTTSVIASYTTYFDFFGQTASFLVAGAYVDLEGTLETTIRDVPVFDETGFSDAYIQFYTTIIGGEVQAPQDFIKTEPGFLLGAFVAAMPPVGEYDQNNLANPGTNRWQWRLGLPMQYIWGRPTQQTSIEFVPTVYLFTDNDELSGGGTLSQEPFFQLEAHVTHDFSQMFWGGLNVLYGFGGETSVNGVAQGDDIDYVSAGFTLGARLSRTFSLSGSYGHRVWSKQSLNDGHWFSISTTATF